MSVPAPISFWNCDESSGNLADAVGSNTLTNNNTTPFVTGLVAGNAIDLENGSSQSFSITDAAQTGLDITGDMSISFWYKPESYITESAFVAKYGTAGNRSFFTGRWDAADQVIMRIQNSAGGETDAIWSGVTLTNGTKYHLVFVYTAASHTADLYYNGTAQTQKDIVRTDIRNGAAPFEVGTDTGILANQDGVMDAIGIWNVALSASDVTALYNAGAGLQYPFPNNYSLTATQGSYTLTGQNINLRRTIIMIASFGSYVLTGQAVILNKGYMMLASFGSYILTGISTAFRFSGWTNQSKNSSSFSNQTKNSSSFSNQTKNSSNWINRNKNQ